MLPDTSVLKIGWHCKCPRCQKGSIYKPGFTMTLREQCIACGLDLSQNDSADGPAFFISFILCGLLVPLALLMDAFFVIPLWVHAVFWTTLILVLSVGMLRPMKALVIALQYKHLPWGDAEDSDEIMEPIVDPSKQG